MRTGDTPADERRAFARTPPDILITTPESLFLLLTSAARDSLRGVETVIVDEVHAVAGTKRGAHLALSLERLDELLPAPAQRIGLSATVRPLDECARFLGGARPVEVVAPVTAKTIEVSVQVPVEDMTRLDEQAVPEDDLAGPRTASIWPAVEERVFALIRAHRSTIVFTNSRRSAERLCARLNELAADETAVAPPAARTPAEMMAQAGAVSGAAPVIARAHHGSVSREERRQIEEALKAGRLPAVVATSSLELGIDMGAVDLVVQIEAPPSVAAGLQRVGRAGHQVGAVSRGWSCPSTGATCSPVPWSPSGWARPPSRSCTIPATRWTCSPSKSSRWSRLTSGGSATWRAWSDGPRPSPSCPTPRCTPSWTCSPAVTRRPLSPSFGPDWCGTAPPTCSPAVRAPNGSR
ncbi:hypothetical protein GCM10029963_29150 [Micromonospora andamanensis]